MFFEHGVYWPFAAVAQILAGHRVAGQSVEPHGRGEGRSRLEPREHVHENGSVRGRGNFPALLLGARIAEAEYAAGLGPHPATFDNATDFVGVEENPLR